MTTLEQLRSYATNANVAAFLRVIRAGESGQGVDAYRTMYGGGLFNVEAGWRHPNTKVTAGGYTSTAAGAYQFLARTWEALSARYGFADFSPGNQDLGAIALIVGRGAIADVLNGDLVAALPKCGREWASLPGSPYGQPTITPARCEAVFRQYGGQLLATEPVGAPVAPEPPSIPEPPTITQPAEPAPQPPKEKRMGMFEIIGALLGAAIPQISKLFDQSEVAKRNTAVAQLAIDTAVKAVGAINEQQAIEKIQSDPAAKEAATAAILALPQVAQLLEVGGGIAVAREHDLKQQASAQPFWKTSAVFWISLILLPLVYWLVGSLIVGGIEIPADWPVWAQFPFKLFGGAWNGESRSGGFNLVIGLVLGGICGVYYGVSVTQGKANNAAPEK